MRSFLTFKKRRIDQNFEGNRSVRSLERDKMCIVSIWSIRNDDIKFLDKMLKSRVKKSRVQYRHSPTFLKFSHPSNATYNVCPGH